MFKVFILFSIFSIIELKEKKDPLLNFFNNKEMENVERILS